MSRLSMDDGMETVESSFLAALLMAILDIAHFGHTENPCWCEHGIGNPMMPDHTPACKRLSELVKRLRNS